MQQIVSSAQTSRYSLEIGTIFSPARTFRDIASLVAVITSNAFFIAGIIAFIFMIVGGFGIIMGAGSGDPKRIEQGKNTLTMAIIGILVIFFSFWIVQLIGLLLGVNPFQLYTRNNTSL